MKAFGVNKKLVGMTVFLIIFAIANSLHSESLKNLHDDRGSDRLENHIVRQDNMIDSVKTLSAKRFAGRLAGTEGNELATSYISDYFRKVGLESPRGLENYLYSYCQSVVKIEAKPVLQIQDARGRVIEDFGYPENFVLRRVSSQTDHLDVLGSMVVLNDLKQLYQKDGSLKGKVLLVPWKYYPQLGSQNSPDDYAQATGALAVIGEFDLKRNALGYKALKVRPLCRREGLPKTYKPFAYVDSGTFAKLAVSAGQGGKLRLSCLTKTEPLDEVSNCIGMIRGSDAERNGGSIIIGAHFDHVGDNLDGTWNPGAFDNASGTAVMMEVARVLSQQKVKPKKTLLFMAFNGEESGINGSWSYCQGPVYLLKGAEMINLDMVGGASGQPLLVATASKTSDMSVSRKLVVEASRLGISLGTLFDDGSDHTAFDNHGVPSVCLLNDDLSRGYHNPGDTIENLSGKRLEEVTRLVLAYIQDNAY